MTSYRLLVIKSEILLIIPIWMDGQIAEELYQQSRNL